MDSGDTLALFRHLDEHLLWLVQTYDRWSYAILFLVIFCETGLVVTPFLSGDSLLFAAGTVAAVGSFDLTSLRALLVVAAVAGDAANYFIGRTLTVRWARRSRLVKQEYLERAELFYRTHGGKAIVIARFAPFLRTFVPFVAGAARMPYRRFGFFNVAGGLIWVVLFSFAGYLFGRVPFVERNFAAVVLGIIILSLLPAILGAWNGRRRGATR